MPAPSTPTTPATDTLGVAVIGCGSLAQGQHLPNIVADPTLRLHACCDISPDNLEACKQRFAPDRLTDDFHDAVNDPAVDLLVLAATEKLRLPVIRAAAEAGKPIYVEKPLAKTLAECLQIQRVVEESGIAFCVGHNRRSAPAMIDAHAIFRRHMTDPRPLAWRWEREPDRPDLPEDAMPGMSVRINDDWHSWKSWVFDPEHAPHGPMLFEMTHFTDMCNWFLDDEPQSVAAIESGMLNHGVVVRYRGGALATLAMCANGTFGYPKELYEMFGRGGAVAVDHMVEMRTVGIADAPARKCYPMRNDRHEQVGTQGGIAGWLEKRAAACDEAAAAGDPSRQFTAEPDKGHAQQLHRFAQEVRGQGPVVCGVQDAVRATRVAFAAILAARERREVDVEEAEQLEA